jgi:hypothetical protein
MLMASLVLVLAPPTTAEASSHCTSAMAPAIAYSTAIQISNLGTRALYFDAQKATLVLHWNLVRDYNIHPTTQDKT